MSTSVMSQSTTEATVSPTSTIRSTPLVVAPGTGEVMEFSASEQFVWKATGSTTGGALDMFEASMPPRLPGSPLHIHDANDEIFYVLEGAYQFQIGEEMVDASAGSFIYAPKGTPHAWVNAHPGVSRMLIHYLPGNMLGFFEATTELIQAVPLDVPALGAAAGRFNTRIVGPPLLF